MSALDWKLNAKGGVNANGLCGFIYAIVPPDDTNPCYRLRIFIPRKQDIDVDVFDDCDYLEGCKELAQWHHDAIEAIVPRWIPFAERQPKVGTPILLGRGQLTDSTTFEVPAQWHYVTKDDAHLFARWTHWYAIEEPRP